MQPNQIHINHHSSFAPETENEHFMNALESSASGQAHLQTSEIDMRAPSSSDELLEKIKLLDFSALASMPKVAESQTKYYEEIFFDQKSRYFSDHAFSLEYWNDINHLSDEEKENKIQAMTSTCLMEFKDEMGNETKQIFAAQGEFNQCLLSMKDQKNFSDLMKVGEEGALESLAENYESDIKTMLFDIKTRENTESTHTISRAIEQHCLFDSTKTLEMLFQNGCTIEEILSLAAHKNSSFIGQLIYENIFFYSFGPINRNQVINKRDDTIMWLMEHGCHLHHLQEIIKNHNCSFLRICATEGNFDLLSKMLKKTEDYNEFIKPSTPGGESLIFLASRVGSYKPSLLDFIRVALRHPGRNQTLNQPNNTGWTPLHEAARNSDIDFLALLLEDDHLSVNDIEAKDQRSYTPISIAMTVLQKESNTEKTQQIERCIEMLENKKQNLMNQNLMIQILDNLNELY